MKKKSYQKIFAIFITFMFIGSSMAYAFFYALPGSNNSNDYTKLAKCLSNKGVVMFGSDKCSVCKKQKRMFGQAFQYINYVDCEENPQACSINNIRAYPTWAINNKKYEGFMNADKLSSLSGC